MESLRSPFENIFSIIGGLPQGHEKPLKHALYNALALLFLFLCCAAAWTLYIILEPFIKPLIWALLVGSVLRPLKYSLATKCRKWFDKLHESRTPIVLGVIGLPVNIINDLSEFVGGMLLNHIKIIIALVITVPAIHVIYYYTPRLCVCIAWKLATYSHTTITWIIDISTTSTLTVLLIGYISVLAIWWKPRTHTYFRFASFGVWVLISCFISHIAGIFQVSIFLALQLICAGGFVYEVLKIHDQMQDIGKHITYLEAALWALENKAPEDAHPASDDIIEEVEKEHEEKKPESDVKSDGDKKEDLWNLELFDNKQKSETGGLIKRTPQKQLNHPSQ